MVSPVLTIEPSNDPGFFANPITNNFVLKRISRTKRETNALLAKFWSQLEINGYPTPSGLSFQLRQAYCAALLTGDKDILELSSMAVQKRLTSGE